MTYSFKKISSQLLLLIISLLLVFAVSNAQQAKDTILIEGEHSKDLYLAGGYIRVAGKLLGDVIAAGGDITFEETIGGDILAAGGEISIDANVNDDVRIAGGKIDITGTIQGDAVIAGGVIHIRENSRINGRTWISGGEIHINGSLNDELKIAGGHVTINGTVSGNVEIRARELEIGPKANIKGILKYRSPDEADVDPAAKIYETDYTQTRSWGKSTAIAGLIIAGVLFLIGLVTSIFLTGLVLYLLLPNVFKAGSNLMQQNLLANIGIGLIGLLLTPIVALILAFFIFGIPLGILLMMVYAILVCVGFYLTAYYLADMSGKHVFKKDKLSTGLHLLLSLVIIFILLILEMIPLIGMLVTFLVLTAGLGTFMVMIYNKIQSS